MTEAIGATGTQADPGTQPLAGDAAAQADAAGEQAQQPENISLEEAKKLRSEASGLRKRLKELEEKDRQASEAQLSEQERSSKRLTELESEKASWELERAGYQLRDAVTTAARGHGFADPADALGLLDRSSIEYEDGKPKNLDKLLADLAKTKPYLLVKETKPQGGSFDTGLGGGRATTRTYTREQLRDPQFFAANKADIMAAAKDGRIVNQ